MEKIEGKALGSCSDVHHNPPETGAFYPCGRPRRQGAMRCPSNVPQGRTQAALPETPSWPTRGTALSGHPCAQCTGERFARGRPFSWKPASNRTPPRFVFTPAGFLKTSTPTTPNATTRRGWRKNPDALRVAHYIDWSKTVGERLDWHEALEAVKSMGDVDLEWASRHPDKIPYVRGWMEAR